MAVINNYTADQIEQTLNKIKGTNALGVSNGGTGKKTLTENAFLLGNGTSAIKAVSPGTNSGFLYYTKENNNISITPYSTLSLDQGGTNNKTWDSSTSGNNLIQFKEGKLIPNIKIAKSIYGYLTETRSITYNLAQETMSVTSVAYGIKINNSCGGEPTESSDKKINNQDSQNILISGNSFWLTYVRALANDHNLGAYSYYRPAGIDSDGNPYTAYVQTYSDMYHPPYFLPKKQRVFPRLEALEKKIGELSTAASLNSNPLRSNPLRNNNLEEEDYEETIDEDGIKDTEEDVSYTGKPILQWLEDLETDTESINSTINETITPTLQSIGTRVTNVESTENDISSFLQELDLENKISDIDENLADISSTLENLDIDNINEKIQEIEDNNIYDRLNTIESLSISNESSLNNYYSQLFDLNNTVIPNINSNITNINSTINGRLSTLEDFKEDVKNLNLNTTLSTINANINNVARCLSKVSEVANAEEFNIDENGNINFNPESNTPYSPSTGGETSGEAINVVVNGGGDGEDPSSSGQGGSSFNPIDILDFSNNSFTIIKDNNITSFSIPNDNYEQGHTFKIGNLTSSTITISLASLTAEFAYRLSSNASSYSLLTNEVATFVYIPANENNPNDHDTWLVY